MRNRVVFLGEAADEQFKSRPAKNDDAFYLNIKTKKKAVIHRADRRHLGDGAGMNSANRPKICSADPDELKEWGKEKDLSPEICSDCDK